ncbi:hypothetical protein V6N13_005260 [Hibiscus sabdariffa]
MGSLKLQSGIKALMLQLGRMGESRWDTWMSGRIGVNGIIQYLLRPETVDGNLLVHVGGKWVGHGVFPSLCVLLPY